MRLGIATAIATAIAIGAVVAIPPPPGGSGSDWYISPTGNDSTGNGSSGNPWKTMNKCYTQAALGDRCLMKAGTYGDSNIDAITTGPKATTTPITQRTVCDNTCVTFTPDTGATVSLAPVGGLFKINASHVRFLNIPMAANLNIWPEGDLFNTAQTPDDVKLDGVTGVDAINIACATNFDVRNMSIGPSDGNSPLDEQSSSSGCVHNPEFGMNYNLTVHDSSNIANPASHVDCTHIFDISDVTFDRINYYGCDHIGFFADSAYAGALACCKNLTIKNSSFQISKTAASGASTIEFAGGAYATDFTGLHFYNNTVIGALSIDTGTPGDVWPSSAVFANNIMEQSFNTCETGSVTFSDNAMPLNNGTHGPTDDNCAGSGNFRLTDELDCITSKGNPNAGPPATPPDVHLITGANPCVNAGNNAYASSYDFFNATRPFNTTVDIGAAERQS